MRTALPEFNGYVFSYALLPEVKHPGVIKRSGVLIGFAADHYEFDIVEIALYIGGFQKRLSRDACISPPILVFGSMTENRASMNKEQSVYLFLYTTSSGFSPFAA